MVTRDFINFIFGCVTLSADNGFAERFINTCTAEGIPLWDIRKTSSGLTAKTSISGYKSIRSPARKSSMKVRLRKKSGIPFIINRHIRRPGLVAGFAVLVCVLFLLSGHIWIVEVTGNSSLPDSEIVEAFESAGLTVGKRVKNLNRAEIESKAMLALGGATWAAINIRGCRALINVREIQKMPEIETHQGTANIIARKDGQIELMEVYRGSAATSPGQTVTKGDMLISGITESRTQMNLFTDADGYVVAKTKIGVATQTEYRQTVLLPKTKKIWSVYFLGIEFLPARQNEGICYERRARLKIGGRALPFGINYRLYTEFEEKEKTISKTEASLMALSEYSLEHYRKTAHAQIIDEKLSVTQNDDGIGITGEYSCYENIGELSPFETQEESAE